MNIIPFLEKGHSGTNDVNLLYNDEKMYVMDNHLAATWCWLQKIDTTQKYNFLHIDRHYDFLNSQTEWWMEGLRNHNVDIRTIDFDRYRKLTYQTKFGAPDDLYKIFRWDNYLTVFHHMYPNLIQTALFATHKDGDRIEDFEISEKDAWDLPVNLSYWISSNDRYKWIVNLDMDYFFTDYEENYFQFFSEEFAKRIAGELRAALQDIEVITLALSPEMCGGWDKAEKFAKIFIEQMGYQQYDEPLIA